MSILCKLLYRVALLTHVQRVITVTSVLNTHNHALARVTPVLWPSLSWSLALPVHMLVTMCPVLLRTAIHAGKVTIVHRLLLLLIHSRFHALKEHIIQQQQVPLFQIVWLVQLVWFAHTLVRGRFKLV